MVVETPSEKLMGVLCVDLDFASLSTADKQLAMVSLVFQKKTVRKKLDASGIEIKLS